MTAVTNQTPPVMPANMTDAQAIQAIHQYYPQYDYMTAVPELLAIAKEAMSKGLSAQAVQSKLFQTQWWQTLPAPSRNWAQLVAQDPAEARRQINAEVSDIADFADKIGAQVTSQQATQLAVAYFSGAQTPQQLASNISQYATYSNYQKLISNPTTTLPDGSQAPTATEGAIGSVMTQLQKIADSYMVPLSNESLFNWAKQVVTGTTLGYGAAPTGADTTSISPTALGTSLSSALDTGAYMGSNGIRDFTQYAQNQAKSLFPSLSSAIDSGQTVTQFADPYKQIAAKVLEIPPDSIDFMDPQWSKALSSVNPQTGARVPMSLSDFQNMIMKDPSYGYQYTNNAKNAAYKMGLNLVHIMGGPVA